MGLRYTASKVRVRINGHSVVLTEFMALIGHEDASGDPWKLLAYVLVAILGEAAMKLPDDHFLAHRLAIEQLADIEFALLEQLDPHGLWEPPAGWGRDRFVRPPALS